MMHLVLCFARLGAYWLRCSRIGLSYGFALFALDHGPALELRNRAVLLDRNCVTDRILVVLVVGVEGLRPPHRLLHHWMGKTALDADDNGLVLFVAHHHALHRTLRHLEPLTSFRSAFAAQRS